MRYTKSDSGRHQRLAAIILGAVVTVSPGLAYGLGLGRLVVESGLNEPLKAYVRIIDATPNNIKTLSPKLASPAIFAAAGMDRHEFLSQIHYSVTLHKDGKYYIDFTTRQGFNEPFIQTLLEVDWAGGQLVREYTALLDPPHWVASRHPAISAPIVAASAAAPTGVTAQPPAQTPVATPSPSQPVAEPLLGPTASANVASSATPVVGAAPQIPAAEASAVPARNRSFWANTTRYKVRRGDTLSGIAHRITADRSISPQQVMIALLQSNPDAFFKHNVNDLISGKILKVPPRQQVVALSKAQAARQFRLQFDAWQEYKVRLAAASRGITVPSAAQAGSANTTPATAARVPATSKPATAAVKTKAGTPVATAKAGSEGGALLRIVRSELNSESIGGQTAGPAGPKTAKKEAAQERAVLSNRMTTLEEQIDARQEKNKELSQKVGTMRKQVRNTARLITVDNQELALEEKKAAEPKPVVKPVVKRPAVKSPVVRRPIVHPPFHHFVPAQPAGEGLIAGILSGILGNPLTLALLGGVVVLGLGILLMYYMRRRRAKAEFEESILSGGSLAAEASSVTDSGSQAAASDTSFLSDFSQGGMGNIHTDEVDPIAEAEVYLAYGRDEQAEEILKEAVVKDPQRQELKQKLLEIYLQRNDVVAFETLAEELYAQIEGKGGRVWEKVEDMGRKISPANPMFRGGAPAAGGTHAFRGAGTDTGPYAPVGYAAGADTARHAAPAAKAAPESLGAGFASAGKAAGDVPVGQTIAADAADTSATGLSDGINFDFDMTPESGAERPASGSGEQSLAPLSTADNDFGLDYKFDSTLSAADASAPKVAATTSADEPAIDFEAVTSEIPRADEGIAFLADSVSDAPVLEFEGATEGDATEQPHWDETTTKLDLAKAYIDMGDSDGARSILDEVIAEGNESQKNQARELAAQIA